jgi:hypothetical protein
MQSSIGSGSTICPGAGGEELMDERLRQLMLEKMKRPAPMDAVRDFLQCYVHDSDMDDLRRIVAHMMSVNPRTIIDGVNGIEAILASPLEPGTLASLVAEDANRSLDDPSDEAARVRLGDLAKTVRAWMGPAGQ